MKTEPKNFWEDDLMPLSLGTKYFCVFIVVMFFAGQWGICEMRCCLEKHACEYARALDNRHQVEIMLAQQAMEKQAKPAQLYSQRE